MKIERNWKRVAREMRKRGLPTRSGGNCNTIASEETREIFYFQWKPKLAMWARFEPHEMDRFRAFLQEQQLRAQHQDSDSTPSTGFSPRLGPPAVGDAEDGQHRHGSQ